MPRAILVRSGETYGHLSVISELQRNSLGKRIFLCNCICGNTTKVVLGDLRNGHTRSCGCQGMGVEFHNQSGSKLYRQWRAMKSRSKERGDSCRIYEDWMNSFTAFMNWSLKNGYKEGTSCLCRTGDKGDYTPDTCRWDTFSNNVIEAKACHWEVTSPEGQLSVIYNLSEFCKTKGLTSSEMSRVASSGTGSHKGWLCRKLIL